MTQKTPKQRINEHLATPEAKEYLKKRNEEIDLELALNQEFDRIWELLNPIIFEKKGNLNLEHLKDNFRGIKDKIYLYYNPKVTPVKDKREILAAFFLLREIDKNGDPIYILKQGDLPNPEYIKLKNKWIGGSDIIDSITHRLGIENLGTISFFELTENIPKNLRELFKQNCFGETQQEIENLKLITW